MQYCSNCGTGYASVKNYCEKCGTRLRLPAGSGSQTGHDERIASSVEVALERTSNRRQRDRINASGSNDGMSLFLGCIGIVAMFQGLSRFMPGMADLVSGEWSLFLILGVVAGILFKLLFDLRLGYSLSRSLLHTVAAGVAMYAVMYGMFWYLDVNVVHSGKPLFELVRRTPVPTVTHVP